MGVSNYYGTEIRNDLAAMKAREECATSRLQLRIRAATIGVDQRGV